MSIRTWTAQVQLKPGWFQEVTVQADDHFRAFAMLESLYGRGSIMGGSVREVETRPVISGSPTSSSGTTFLDHLATIFSIAAFFVALLLGQQWYWALAIAVVIAVGTLALGLRIGLR
jgi:hypothetical protein